MRRNSFLVCSACDEIGSEYAQHAIKSFPRMLSICMLLLSKMTQKSLIKMQISPIKIKILKNRLGTYLIGPKWRFWKKIFWVSLKKNLVPRMLSHRGNVRTSKFWRKSKEKKRNFFRRFTKGIKGFDLGQKKFKIISCLCTFKQFFSDNNDLSVISAINFSCFGNWRQVVTYPKHFCKFWVATWAALPLFALENIDLLGVEQLAGGRPSFIIWG